MNNKRISIIIALLASLVLSACVEPVVKIQPGTELAVQDSGMKIANPIRQMSREELIEESGVDLGAPENAEDLVYSIIELEGANPVAQLRFTLDEQELCFRAQYIGTEKAEDISGLYYEWERKEYAYVNYCAGLAFFAGELGYIKWFDPVSGIQYSLSMTEGAKFDAMLKLAETVFVPLQQQ